MKTSKGRSARSIIRSWERFSAWVHAQGFRQPQWEAHFRWRAQECLFERSSSPINQCFGCPRNLEGRLLCAFHVAWASISGHTVMIGERNPGIADKGVRTMEESRKFQEVCGRNGSTQFTIRPRRVPVETQLARTPPRKKTIHSAASRRGHFGRCAPDKNRPPTSPTRTTRQHKIGSTIPHPSPRPFPTEIPSPQHALTDHGQGRGEDATSAGARFKGEGSERRSSSGKLTKGAEVSGRGRLT